MSLDSAAPESVDTTGQALRVVMLHPNLGLGGAERLFLDAAAAIRAGGNEVFVLTNHYDLERSFPDSRDVNIEVGGSFLPGSIMGRLIAPCTVLRLASLIPRAAQLRPQIIFVDLVPHIIPLIRRFLDIPVLYYGHFPDALLAPRRTGWMSPYLSSRPMPGSGRIFRTMKRG